MGLLFFYFGKNAQEEENKICSSAREPAECGTKDALPLASSDSPCLPAVRTCAVLLSVVGFTELHKETGK